MSKAIMVSNCGGIDFFGLTEAGFFRDIATLMELAVPAAIVFILWRVLVTNKSQSIQGLDLNDTACVEPDRFLQISRPMLFLYVITGIATFTAGVISFEICQQIVEFAEVFAR